MSADTLWFRFHAPAEILGVLVSVDVDSHLTLVEIAVRINNAEG